MSIEYLLPKTRVSACFFGCLVKKHCQSVQISQKKWASFDAVTVNGGGAGGEGATHLRKEKYLNTFKIVVPYLVKP